MTTTILQSVTETNDIDTGIDDKKTVGIAKALSKALADSYTLYVKTLGVHWNVTGPAFYSLHKLTEAQYEDLHAAADAIAERVRALGQIAPASYDEFKKLSKIESSKIPMQASEMLDELIADNEIAAKRFREFVTIAEEAEDVFTADMLTSRIGQHEENIWMLKSMRG
ncbi:MAG: DNA starvation/stationary phase protection protein [Parasphingorhabdus sp.]|uniref:Dps family protein n=1 Tax=Parasphingorhabdus sp. TaxID=2709688 RepID=UPI00300252DF